MTRVDARSLETPFIPTNAASNVNTLPEESSAWSKAQDLGSRFFSTLWTIPKSLYDRVSLGGSAKTFVRLIAFAYLGTQGAHAANYTDIPSMDLSTLPGISNLHGDSWADGSLNLVWEHQDDIHGLALGRRGNVRRAERRLNNDTTYPSKNGKSCALSGGRAFHLWDQFTGAMWRGLGQFTNSSLDNEGPEAFLNDHVHFPTCTELEDGRILLGYIDEGAGRRASFRNLHPNGTYDGNLSLLTSARSDIDCVGFGGGHACTWGYSTDNRFRIEASNGTVIYTDSLTFPLSFFQEYSQVVLTDDQRLAWSWRDDTYPHRIHYRVTDLEGNEIVPVTTISPTDVAFILDREPFAMAGIRNGFIIGFSGNNPVTGEIGIFLPRFFTNGTQADQVNLLERNRTLPYLVGGDDGYLLFFRENETLHGVRFNDQNQPTALILPETSGSPSVSVPFPSLDSSFTSSLRSTALSVTSTVRSTLDSVTTYLSSWSSSETAPSPTQGPPASPTSAGPATGPGTVPLATSPNPSPAASPSGPESSGPLYGLVPIISVDVVSYDLEFGTDGIPTGINVNFSPNFQPEDGTFVPLFTIPEGMTLFDFSQSSWESLIVRAYDYECFDANGQLLQLDDGSQEYGILYTEGNACRLEGGSLQLDATVSTIAGLFGLRV